MFLKWAPRHPLGWRITPDDRLGPKRREEILDLWKQKEEKLICNYYDAQADQEGQRDIPDASKLFHASSPFHSSDFLSCSPPSPVKEAPFTFHALPEFLQDLPYGRAHLFAPRLVGPPSIVGRGHLT